MTYANEETRMNHFHLHCPGSCMSAGNTRLPPRSSFSPFAFLYIHLPMSLCLLSFYISPSALLSLRVRRLIWLGYAPCVGVDRISKDHPCGQFVEGVRPIGLRFKDICKRDMKLTDVDINTRKNLVLAARGGMRTTDQKESLS